MIPRTYPSTFAPNGQQQMVVYFLTSVVGLQRWVDYIPVHLSDGGVENSYNNNGYINVAIVPSLGGTIQAWKDYIPVYQDAVATDAWQVSSVGYIPYNYSGFGDASLILDFTNGGALDSRVTFTRASTGTCFNSAGVLQSTASDAPRFDYNPVTRQPLGLLIEESRTNSIRNNTMVGAVSGTPGTLPTNWGGFGGVPSGITTSVVGTGTEDGITYIDIRYNGTPSTNDDIQTFPEGGNSIPASATQVWTGSFYLKIAAGTTTNTSNWRLNLVENSAVPAFLRQTLTNISTPTSGKLNSQRPFASATLGASTAFISSSVLFSVTSGQAIDITLRIGLPQMEQGGFATSVIPTTTAAATRAADNAVISTLTPWFNATEGTLLVRADTYTNTPSPTRITALLSSPPNGYVMLKLVRPSGLTGLTVVNDANVVTADIVGASGVANTMITIAGAYKANDFALGDRGVLYGPDLSGDLPASFAALYIGCDGSITQQNGHIARLAYYPRRLSNAELQILTS